MRISPKFLELAVVGYLFFGLVFAFSIGPEMVSYEKRHIYELLFGNYREVQIEQTGNLGYVNPVTERAVHVDPSLAVTRAVPEL